MNRKIHEELRGVAQRVAQRIRESPYRDEVDHYVIRSAIYAVFIYDQPELETTLSEVERLTREALKGPGRPSRLASIAALIKRLRG
jgi:hypothetical protein